ncbi:MAG: hypothetical protein L6W00_25665 [Lentisphaeria bacterium]|nr:MAG: hypothetical protein L6W00_25665 [Lentisphaeria bacterium]
MLAEHNLQLPMIGCDGLNIPGLPGDRHVVVAPRRECGRRTAELLVAAIAGKRHPESLVIPAYFR